MAMSGLSDPPDGGWGWVMVGAAFACHILGGAVYGALGVLYVAWLDEFGLGKAMTSWIISLAFGVLFCSGPIASTLANRFGYRAVAVTGSIMASGGFIVCYWAPSVPFLIFFIGIVSGAGSGFTYIPCVAVVTSYFKKNLSVATGIYASGAGLGSFIMAPLMNFLDETYGWRGALLITGAIVFHTCAASLLFTPFIPTFTESDPESQDCLQKDCEISEVEKKDLGQDELKKNAFLNYEDIKGSQEVIMTSSRENPLCIGPPYSTNSVPTNEMKTSLSFINAGDKYHYLKRDVNGLQNSLTNMTPSPCGKELDGTEKRNSFNEESSRKMLPFPSRVQHLKIEANPERASNSLNDLTGRKERTLFLSQSLHGFQHQNSSSTALSKSLRNFDIRVLGSLKDLFEEKLQKQGDSAVLLKPDPELDPDTATTTTSTTDSMLLKKDDDGKACSTCQRSRLMQSFLKSVELLKDRTFLVLFISNFFTCVSYTTPLVFLVDRAVDNDIGRSLAAMLISITGIGNILGRLFFGVITDRIVTSPLVCYIGIVGLNAVSTMLSPLCGEFVILHGVYAFLYGTTIGAFAVLAVVVTVDLMGRDHVAAAFGLYLLSAGAGSVLGPPLGGWLNDWTKTYVLTYLVTGCFTLFSALMLIPLEILRRRRWARHNVDP